MTEDFTMKRLCIGILAIAFCLAFVPFAVSAAPGDATLLPLEGDGIDMYVEQ
jgi:hypothetical protein